MGNILSIWFGALVLLLVLFVVYRILLKNSDPFWLMNDLYNSNVMKNFLSKSHLKQLKKAVELGKSVNLHKKQNIHNKSKAEKNNYKAIYSEIYYHAELFYIQLKQTIPNNSKDQALNKEIENELRLLEELVHKLSELDNMYIQLEADAYIEGTEEIDELISSLKELV